MNDHSRPLSTSEAAILLVSIIKNRDLWEAPIFEHAQSEPFVFSANQISRLDPEHTKTVGKSVNCEFPVLDLPRGRDSWS